MEDRLPDGDPRPDPRSPQRAALRVTPCYALPPALPISLSDLLVRAIPIAFLPHPLLQAIEGLLFVGVTAAMVFLFQRNESVARRERAEASLRRSHRPLEIRRRIDRDILAAGYPQDIARPALIAQVPVHLLANAVEFVARDMQRRLRVSAKTHSWRVRLAGEDNAIGTDPEHNERVPRIFERLHGGEACPGPSAGMAMAGRVTVQREGESV